MPPVSSNPPAADYSITQNFPVADHIYKYLKIRCGGDHIVASRDHSVGSLALSLLGRNNDVRPKKVKFNKIFYVTIPESAYQKNGMYVSAENAQLFNDHMDKKFREELFYHVIISKAASSKLFLQSIRDYLELYDITEDDIKLDSLYRDFKRRKENYDNNLNLTPAGRTN